MPKYIKYDIYNGYLTYANESQKRKQPKARPKPKLKLTSFKPRSLFDGLLVVARQRATEALEAQQRQRVAEALEAQQPPELPWIVGVRSYGRPGRTSCAGQVGKGVRLTLDLLEETLPGHLDRCFLFLAREDPALQEYQRRFAGTLWEDKIILGVKGAEQQVAFMEKACPRNTHLIVLDDNIHCVSEGRKSKVVKCLHRLFHEAHEALYKYDAHVWATNPSTNNWHRTSMRASSFATCASRRPKRNALRPSVTPLQRLRLLLGRCKVLLGTLRPPRLSVLCLFFVLVRLCRSSSSCAFLLVHIAASLGVFFRFSVPRQP